MKKILLIISLVVLAFNASAQIVVQGISPNSIQTNFNFTWADPSNSSGWATPDWNIPGNFVQSTLMLVEDGTAGTNAQGNPISQEGCSPLINNLTGKIAVVYRNTCDFSTKALNAQNAGAVGVIIINRDPDVSGMGPAAYGANVTIPVVMLSSIDGANLVAEMANGPVEVLMGNVQNLYANNVSIKPAEALISKYGSVPYNIANNGYSFSVGLQALNAGLVYNTFSFNANITDPNGNVVYDNNISNVPMVNGEVLPFFPGNTYTFPDFTMTNPIIGKYTLTYTAYVDGLTDEMNYDNIITSSFYVTNDVLSLARQDETTGNVRVNSYPSNTLSSYKACMKLQDVYPNNSNKLAGLYFAVSSENDTIENEQVTAEIFEWNDGWSDISGGWSTVTFDYLNQIGNIDYVCSSNADNGVVVYAPFNQAITLNDNQRYLVCLTTFNPEISFGYDNGINYNENYVIYSQPISPIQIETATNGLYWYSGWTNTSAFSLGLKLIDCNIAPTSQTINISTCDGYTSASGQTFYQTGVYNDIVYSVLGCDSLYLTINLTILNSNSSFSATICDGDSYTWNGQQYYQAGQYYQTLVNQFGCDSVVELNLNTIYNDYIYITPNPAFGNAPLNVAFANQSPDLSNYNFTWYFGDGSSQQSNAPFLSHTYTQDGYADVTVVAENITTGCISSQTFNDIIFVIGGVSCTHSATINQTGPLTACSGVLVQLSCNTNASFSYQWNRNGVPVNGATSSTYYPIQSGSYTVTIYQNNCPVTSNGISVTINPLPNVPVITSTGTITPCSGGSMTLNAPSGYSSYNWNTGGTLSSLIVYQSGNYSVTVTDNNGCSSSSSPFAVNASIMAPPQVCIVGMDSLTNENRIVWEKPQTLGIDSFYVYKESNVSNVYTKIGSTDYNQLAVFLDVNSNPAIQAYRYKISALDTCGVETNVGDFHKTIHLTVNLGVNNTINLIWSHYEGLNFGSYNIYRGTSLSNMALLTTIQSNLNSYSDLTPPTGIVYYQIEIVNPVNCDPTKSINYGVSRSNIVNYGQNSAGITEELNSTMQVYPNPTNDKFTLGVSNDLLEKQYVITDFSGRIIQQGKINSLNQIIELTNVSNGSYLLQVEHTNAKALKIVKQ